MLHMPLVFFFLNSLKEEAQLQIDRSIHKQKHKHTTNTPKSILSNQEDERDAHVRAHANTNCLKRARVRHTQTNTHTHTHTHTHTQLRHNSNTPKGLRKLELGTLSHSLPLVLVYSIIRTNSKQKKVSGCC